MPGPVTKLQRSFAYRVAKVFPNGMLRWMDVVSGLLDNLSPGGGAQQNTVFVAIAPAGSDTTGDGSFDKPFLTIAKAMSTITTASVTNPWIVDAGPGVFATSFTVKNGVYVIGKGSGSGQYNGSPLTAVTTVAPHTTQVLDASFSGAADKSGGILHCAFSQDCQADFNAIGSTGNGSFYLDEILTENDVIFVGATANVNDIATIGSLYINAAADLKFINMGASVVRDFVSDFGGNVLYQQSAAFQSFHEIAGSFLSTITMTWTSAAIGNSLNVIFSGASSSQPIITGNGVVFVSRGAQLSRTMTDAANRLAFGTDAAGTIVGLSGGENIIRCTPTANRVLTIVTPNGPTKIRVVNLAAATFNIDLAFTAGTQAIGNPTYVPPGGEVEITYDPPLTTWFIPPYTQRFPAVVLTGGVSAALVPADVNARTAGAATLTTYSGVPGTPKLAAADFVVGSRAGGGGFKLHSITPATGADVATDNGTYLVVLAS